MSLLLLLLLLVVVVVVVVVVVDAYRFQGINRPINNCYMNARAFF